MSAPRSRFILAAFLGLAGTGLGLFVPPVRANRVVQANDRRPAASEKQLWIVNPQESEGPTDLPPYEIKLLQPLPDPRLPAPPPAVPAIRELPTPRAGVATTPRPVEVSPAAGPPTPPMTKSSHTAPSSAADGDVRSPADYLSRIDRILMKMRAGETPRYQSVAPTQPPRQRPEPGQAARYAEAAAAPTPAPRGRSTASPPTPAKLNNSLAVAPLPPPTPVEPAPAVAVAKKPSAESSAAEVPKAANASIATSEGPQVARPEKKRPRLLSLLSLPGFRQSESTTKESVPPAPTPSSVVRTSPAPVVQASAAEPLPPIELSLPEAAKVAVKSSTPRSPATSAAPTAAATAQTTVDPLAVRAAAANLAQPKSLIQSTLDLARRASPTPEPQPKVATVQTALAEEPVAESNELPQTTPYPERPKIYFRPAVAQVNGEGYPILRPQVRVAGRQTPPATPVEAAPQGLAEQIPLEGAEAVPPAIEAPLAPGSWSAPFVAEHYEQCGPPPRLGPCQELLCRLRARLNGPCSVEPGIGTERVMHAISFIDTSQPQNNFRLRFDAAYDYQTPDRAEYFWAKIGSARGPTAPPNFGERSLDYQEVESYMELGGEKFSVGTSIPIMIIDPETYGNTSGLGDITITTKTVFLDGKRWQLTNLFRTYVPSGDSKAGLGTGHASIEPGLAWRYKWSDITYLHGDLKYWVPLGGDPVHSGEMLNYGFGISHVWRESDSFAIMPTLELVAYSFLDGQFTAPGSTATVEVDPQGILLIHPGVRWVWDNGGDCGVREFGIFGGMAATSDSVYEEILRAEIRWVW